MQQHLYQIVVSAMLSLSIGGVAAGDASTKIEMLPLVSADVRQGTLPNGLRYLIKPNAEPAGKVEMRLLVNVCSLTRIYASRCEAVA